MYKQRTIMVKRERENKIKESQIDHTVQKLTLNLVSKAVNLTLHTCQDGGNIAARVFSNSTAVFRSHLRLRSTFVNQASLSPPAKSTSYSANCVLMTSSMMVFL